MGVHFVKQIFMSHSQKDALVKQVFDDIFAKTDVKPIWMEYERWSQRKDEPNWRWVSRHISMPETIAVFVLLTRNVINVDYPERTLATQNWVSYEIGVASATSKPVFVFKEEDVDFPVPYLTNYMPYSITKTLTTGEKEWYDPRIAKIVKTAYKRVMHSIINDLKREKKASKAPKCQCGYCLASFHYHGTSASFKCPCCSKEISTLS